MKDESLNTEQLASSGHIHWNNSQIHAGNLLASTESGSATLLDKDIDLWEVTGNVSSLDYNGTWNDSSFYVNDMLNSTRSIYTFILPVICVIGLIGNSLAAFTFLSKLLRKSSCSLFLAARSASDSLFLSCVLLIWMSDSFMAPTFHSHGLCQFVVFLTYVCGFLSVWFVVCVTLENYVRVCHPFAVARLCTTHKANGIILCLMLLAIGIFHFPLWTNKVISNGIGVSCQWKVELATLYEALTYTDSLITLVIPLLIIILLMIIITFNILKSNDIHRRNAGSQPRAYSKNAPQGKVTKMLCSISFTFLFLNIPSHVIRLKLLLQAILIEHYRVSQTEFTIQLYAQLVYYISFAINFPVYLVCGDNFRRIFCDIITSCLPCPKRCNEEEHLEIPVLRPDLCTDKSNGEETTYFLK